MFEKPKQQLKAASEIFLNELNVRKRLRLQAAVSRSYVTEESSFLSPLCSSRR